MYPARRCASRDTCTGGWAGRQPAAKTEKPRIDSRSGVFQFWVWPLTPAFGLEAVLRRHRAETVTFVAEVLTLTSNILCVCDKSLIYLNIVNRRFLDDPPTPAYTAPQQQSLTTTRTKIRTRCGCLLQKGFGLSRTLPPATGGFFWASTFCLLFRRGRSLKESTCRYKPFDGASARRRLDFEPGVTTSRPAPALRRQTSAATGRRL